MIKKLTLLLICCLVPTQAGLAKEYFIKIKPSKYITTSNVSLKEADYVDFTVVEDVITPNYRFVKGDTVTGLITNLKDNEFWVQPASLYIEGFKTQDGKSLKGVVYKKGNDHNLVFDVIFIAPVRGGEVQMNPDKDTFILSVEDK